MVVGRVKRRGGGRGRAGRIKWTREGYVQKRWFTFLKISGYETLYRKVAWYVSTKAAGNKYIPLWKVDALIIESNRVLLVR